MRQYYLEKYYQKYHHALTSSNEIDIRYIPILKEKNDIAYDVLTYEEFIEIFEKHKDLINELINE